MNEPLYYFLENGEVIGPYTKKELEAHATLGRIKDSTLVCKNNEDLWRAWADVKGTLISSSTKAKGDENWAVLKGSVKQIDWVKGIRKEAIAALRYLEPAYRELIKSKIDDPDVRFWIDNRNSFHSAVAMCAHFTLLKKSVLNYAGKSNMFFYTNQRGCYGPFSLQELRDRAAKGRRIDDVFKVGDVEYLYFDGMDLNLLTDDDAFDEFDEFVSEKSVSIAPPKIKSSVTIPILGLVLLTVLIFVNFDFIASHFFVIIFSLLFVIGFVAWIVPYDKWRLLVAFIKKHNP